VKVGDNRGGAGDVVGYLLLVVITFLLHTFGCKQVTRPSADRKQRGWTPIIE
jgi:hypothetical protein